MKITSYTVAGAIYQSSVEAAAYRKDLEDQVNAMIAEGWQPHGSLQIVANSDGLMAFQPMVQFAVE